MEAANLTLRINTEGMNEAQRGMEGLTNTADMLEGAFRKVAAAWASWEIFKQIRDVTTLAARYDTLGVVMQTIGNNAGYTGKEMAGFQASLEKTGISMLAARQSLTMMAAAQLDLTKASQLGRVAQDAAVIGNVNSSEAFETLTRSITTGMAIEAHRLGIMVNYRRAEHDYAAAIGKTTEQLTDQEKQAARLNEVLAQGALRQGAYTSAMETAGKQALSMERYVENLQVMIGRTFQPAYSEIIRDMTSALESGAQWAGKESAAIDSLGSSFADVVREGTGFLKLLSDIGGGAKGANDGVSGLTWTMRGLALSFAVVEDAVRAFVSAALVDIGALIRAVGGIAPKGIAAKAIGINFDMQAFGEGMVARGNEIGAPLSNGTATTALLDKWLADQQTAAQKIEKLKQDVATMIYGGRGASSLMASHSTDPAEQARILARILAGIKARTDALKDQNKAVDDLYETNRSLYWLESSKGGDGWAAGNAHALGAERTVAQNLLAPATEKASFNFQKLEDSTTTLMRKMRDAAESGDMFAAMGYEVANSSGYAADALTRWSTNVDGLGVSWTTLGNTVRNVLADMIRQMERAVIQQKLMDPLLQAAGSWIFNLGNPAPAGGGTSFGSGSGWSTSGGVGAGGFTGKLFAAPGGGSQPTIVNNIAVTVTDGKASTSADAGKGGEDIAKNLKGLMNQWAVEQSRSGGILAARA